MRFKERMTFDKRLAEAIRVLNSYPDRIPIICEKADRSNVKELFKKKFLVPKDLTFGQFIFIIRKGIHLSPEQGLYAFIGGVIPPTSETMHSIYSQYKDPDNFLYVEYCTENTFGS